MKTSHHIKWTLNNYEDVYGMLNLIQEQFSGISEELNRAKIACCKKIALEVINTACTEYAAKTKSSNGSMRHWVINELDLILEKDI